MIFLDPLEFCTCTVGAQSCGVECLLSIDPVLALAVGLQDGRLVCYDLRKLQPFYMAAAPPRISNSSLVEMDYMVPPDDPRIAFYICTMHHNGQVLYAFLYSFMYTNRSSNATTTTPRNLDEMANSPEGYVSNSFIHHPARSENNCIFFSFWNFLVVVFSNGHVVSTDAIGIQ